MCGRAAGLARLRVPVPVVPPGLVGLAAALTTTAPFHTVTSLIESLRHDMVCRPGPHVEAEPRADRSLGLEEAVERAMTPMYAGPEGALPSDPAWTRTHALLAVVPLPAVGKAAAHLAFHRVRSVLAGGW